MHRVKIFLEPSIKQLEKTIFSYLNVGVMQYEDIQISAPTFIEGKYMISVYFIENLSPMKDPRN